MKIFVLLSRVPYPLDKGDKLRAFHQVKELSYKHEIVLCALAENPVSEQAKNILKKYCIHLEIIPLKKHLIPINIAKAFFSGKPLQVGYFYQDAVQEKINELIKIHTPDHIFCQLVRVTEYVKHFNLPKTLDYMDALSKGLERRIEKSGIFFKPVLSFESWRMRKFEEKVFDLFPNKSIISLQDQALISHLKRNEISIIPNGVDTEYFKPTSVDQDFDLVFTGNMSYPPNIECAEYLAKEILPEIHRKKPGVKLLISGVNPTHKIKALASEFVTISGWVEDIRTSYSRAKIFIAPMRIGTGLQNKLLEAMAMRLPCITSALANNALGAREGEEILIGRDTADFTQHVMDLLENEGLRARIAEKGHSFINNSYNWKKSGALLEELLNKRGISI